MSSGILVPSEIRIHYVTTPMATDMLQLEMHSRQLPYSKRDRLVYDSKTQRVILYTLPWSWTRECGRLCPALSVMLKADRIENFLSWGL